MVEASIFFFSQLVAGLTNRVPVRDSRAGAPLGTLRKVIKITLRLLPLRPLVRVGSPALTFSQPYQERNQYCNHLFLSSTTWLPRKSPWLFRGESVLREPWYLIQAHYLRHCTALPTLQPYFPAFYRVVSPASPPVQSLPRLTSWI